VAVDVPDVLPLLPLEGTVLFPYTMSSLAIRDSGYISLTEDVTAGDRLVVFVPAAATEEPDGHMVEPFPVGCVGRIVKMIRFPDETVRVLTRGIRRVRIDEVITAEPSPCVRISEMEDTGTDTVEAEAVARNAQIMFNEIIGLSPHLPDELRVALLNIYDYGRLADLIADTIGLAYEEKLQVLAAEDVQVRLSIVNDAMARELNVLRLGNEIQAKVNTAFAEHQREQLLREQLRAIQEQLGEEPDTPDIAELRQKMADADLPKEAREAAERELDRLRRMHPAAADYNVSRTYVEWLLDMPWQTCTEDRLDIRKARRILDADHYDLDLVKDRILEHLAVMQLKTDGNSPVLCFVGPPGVGKTSLGQSIARAMGREFVRISLGGIRDEAEIRGHRRTYVSALPGRILQGIRKAKTANPVFMLDEIDKLGTDFRGDPGSALLEVLDPQQNNAFSDHYLEVSFDLSRVMFITTANLLDPIPPALLDRMEVIRIPGYTRLDKRHIARRFLIPRQLETNGLSKSQLAIKPTAVDGIVSQYTMEAGVRNLEREIGRVCRKHARRIVEGDADPAVRASIGVAELADYLGPRKVFPDLPPKTPGVGIATGLAWTSAGGETLQIEVNALPGTGKLTLTGSLGDVMKESAQIALSYVRSRHEALGVDDKRFSEQDFHIHVPAGATPKDGPSAGIAIACALASLATDRPVRPGLAMTGEISLRGRVLPIGGLKEKLLAAARAKLTTVIIPAQNSSDLEDIPEEIRSKLTVVQVTDAASVLDVAFAT